MRAILLLVVLALTLCLSGCSSSSPKAGEDPAREIVEAKGALFSGAVTRASAAAWASSEVDSLVSLYTSDATLFPPDGPLLKGHEAIKRYWTRPSSRRILQHRVTVEHAESSGDLLYEYGRFTLTFQKDDDASKEGQARYVSVWRRDTHGDWRKHLDIWW